MTKIKRLVAVALALLMILGSFSTAAFAADGSAENGTTLSISTKIFRLVDGTWIETEKVKAGEEVMARVYVDTDYFTNSGNLLFFYNNTFFTDDFGTTQEQLDVNPEYKGGVYGISGNFVGAKSVSTVEKVMVNAGKIDSEFAAENDFVFINYFFGSNYANQKLDGSKWLFQIPLTVSDNPVAEEGIFQAVEATTLSADFAMGKINVPRGEEGGHNSTNSGMDLWSATLEYSAIPVELFETPVAVTFNSNYGKYADGSSSKYFEGEAGDSFTVEEPTRSNFEFIGWKEAGADDSTASKVVAYPAQDTIYEAVWKSTTDSDETLGFRTEIYRQDENGEWIQTDRVKRGEDVKARVFVDTSYYAQAGNIMFFYDKDFFEDEVRENAQNILQVNPNEVAAHGTYGLFTKVPATSSAVKLMLNSGYISQSLVDESVIYTMNYEFSPAVGNILSDDEWFVEFDLTVREDAPSGEYGDFYISMDTVQSVEKYKAYVNIPRSTEGGDDIDSEAMYLWNANVSIESNPVTIDSKVTLDANGGLFADGTNKQEIAGVVGDAIDAGTIPSVSKDGAVFLGWVDATIENPTEADVIDIPAEIPHDDLVLNALWLNKINVTYVIGYGAADIVESVVPGDAFVAPEDPTHDDYTFVGWSTDGQNVTELPEVYPDVNTIYYAVWIDKVNITYKFNNGDEDLVETVTAGDPLVAPADPSKEGYKFIGWSTVESGAEITGLPANYPSDDTTYYAIYNPAEFVIQYYVINPETNKFENVDEGLVTYGEPVIPVPPSYEAPVGYTLSVAYTDVTLSTPLADGATMPAGVLNLYYNLEAKSYDAIFKVDGEEYAKVSTEFGKEIKAPADPEKEGYVFMGWTPEVGFMDTEGATFNATWQKAEYTATYIVDGETYEEYTIAYGEEVDVPADPYKEGYEFTGWTPEIPETMPAEKQVFKAAFTVNVHKATFTVDGEVYAEEETEYGANIVVPKEPTKTGYVFAGWEPAVPESMPDEDLEFAAKWEPAKNTPYKIQYVTMDTKGNYGTPVVENRTGETGSTVTVTGNPSEGFKVADDSVLEAEILADGSTVLVVKYERLQYTVKFDPANGEAVSEENYYYGATVTEPEEPKLEGHTFVEWKPLVFGTVTTDVTYVAQYKANEYTITFGETGDTVIAPITQDFGTAIEAPADPVKEGYTFAGWDAEIPATMPAENVTINATWKINQYTITINPDNGDEATVITQDYNTDIPAVAVPEKEGYTWAGWDTEIPAKMPAENMTITGQWDINEYTITFGNTGDTVIDPITQDYGTDIVKPADPEKFGYTFAGWDAEIPATMPAGDVTINATWTINSYPAEFYAELDDAEAYKTTSVEYLAKINAVPSPTKQGYEFGGWSTDGVNALTDLGSMDTEGKKFYAVWTPANVNYTVEHYYMGTDGNYPETADPVETFSGKTESVAKTSGKIEENFTVDTAKSVLEAEILADGSTVLKVYYIREKNTLKVNIDGEITEKDYYLDAPVDEIAAPEKEGFEFAGWVDANGDPTEVPATMPADDVTLKATWTANEYDVTYFVNGEPYSGPTATAFGTPIAEPAVPTKAGYTFIGWKEITDGKKPSDYGVMPAKALEFEAQWKANTGITYVVEIYEMGTDGKYPATATETKILTDGVVGQKVTVTAEDRAGFVFESAKSLTTGTVPPTGVLTLKLYYARNSHTMTVTIDGTTTTKTYYYGQEIEEIAEPTKEGYTFEGWTAAIPETMPDDDVTTEAIFTKNSYTVTWVVDDEETEATVAYDDAIVKPADPEKAGYEFTGWTPEVPAKMPAKDLEFKATWKANAHTATFNANGGKFADGADSKVVNVNYGDVINAPVAPTMDGYAFAGWTPSVPEAMPDENLEFKATWAPVAGTNYIVETYTMDKYGNYGDPIVEVRSGSTGGTATVETNPTDGFYVTDDSVTSAVIAADGTTKLVVKYARYQYTVKFDPANGETVSEQKYYYGSTVTAPADPKLEGHTFKEWKPLVFGTVTTDVTYVAQYEANEYTITFGETGDTVIAPITQDFGTAIEAPADPVKEGYTFAGWDAEIPATMPAENVEINATWTVNQYTITVDPANGEAATVITQDYNTDIPAVATPVKEGYTWLGWDAEIPAKMPAENMTITGQWDINEYTITFGNTGDTVIDPITQDYGTAIEAPADPVKKGYTFTGWDAEIPATMPADDVIVNATWQINQYTISFKETGDTVINDITLDYGAVVPTVATPVREGYTWNGWDKEIPANMPAEDTVITGQWDINEYTITFGNTGDTVIDPITQDYGTAVEAPADPTRFGYTFDGWSAEIPATMPAKNQTINAKWKANSYAAEFYAELDDTVPYDNPSVTFNEYIDAPADNPTKDGYEFLGWSTDGETVIYDLGKMDTEGKKFYAVWEAKSNTEYTVEHYYMTTELTYADDADKTEKLTAETATTVTATPEATENFTVDEAKSVLEATVAGDGSTVLKVYYIREVNTLRVNIDGKVTDKEYPFDAPVDAITEPTKEGYTFAGWVDDEGNKVDYPATMPGEDVSLNASWDAIAFEVTYIVDGETYYGPKAVDFGTPIGEPTVPVKVGHTFAGWEDADGKKPGDYGVMPAKDLEFTAKWNANTDIGYVIEIYEMDTEGNYPEKATDKYTLEDGVVGESRTVTPEVRYGFVLDAEKSVLTGVIPAEGTLVLKAYYIRNGYKLIVDVDGTVTETPYMFGEEVTPVADPEKTGYTFAGWVDENNEETEIPVVMPNNDVKVFATWEVVKYDAIFNAGEGTFSDGKNEVTVPVEYDSAISAPADKPELEGYEFGGWATKDDPKTPVTDFGKMTENGAEYVAIWNKVDFTLTFYGYDVPANNPKVPTIDGRKVISSTTMTYGDAIELPEGPEFAHHVFLGWTTVEFDADFIVGDDLTMPAENLTLYACYERVQVMLIPKNDTCTTVIDRNGLTVDDYVDGESKWYVYGLVQLIKTDELLEEYIDVSGDGRIELVFEEHQNSGYPGTGTTINVYDNVTGELVESFRIIIFGDLNGDTHINAVDVSIATDESLLITGWSSVNNPETYVEYRYLAADINRDGRINAVDVSIITDNSLGIYVINQRTLAD